MNRISPLLFFIFIFLCFLGFRTCFLVFVRSGISFFGFLFICTSDRSDYYCVHPFIANYSSQNTVIVFEIINKKINLLIFFSLSICQTPAPSSSPSPWPQKYYLLGVAHPLWENISSARCTPMDGAHSRPQL